MTPLFHENFVFNNLQSYYTSTSLQCNYQLRSQNSKIKTTNNERNDGNPSVSVNDCRVKKINIFLTGRCQMYTTECAEL